MKPLSPSGLTTFLDCEYRFYLNYHQRQYSKVDFSYFMMGTAVHTVIEIFYLARIQADRYSEEEQFAWCLDKLVTEFARSFSVAVKEPLARLEELTLAKEDATDVRAELDAFGRDKKPMMVFFKSLSEMYLVARKCLRNFVSIHRILQEEHKSYKIIHEYRVEPPVCIEGIAFTGRIDRIDVTDNDSYIYDYKTGQQYWKVDDVNTNIQIAGIYSEAMLQEFGATPGHVGIIDLQHNKIVTGTPSSAQTADLKSHILRIATGIKQANEEYTNKPKEDIDFRTAPRSGEKWKCKTCSWAYDPDNRCPYSSLSSDDVVSKLPALAA